MRKSVVLFILLVLLSLIAAKLDTTQGEMSNKQLRAQEQKPDAKLLVEANMMEADDNLRAEEQE